MIHAFLGLSIGDFVSCFWSNKAICYFLTNVQLLNYLGCETWSQLHKDTVQTKLYSQTRHTSKFFNILNLFLFILKS